MFQLEHWRKAKLDVEEHSFLFALQADIESPRARTRRFWLGQQGSPPQHRHQSERGIFFVSRIARKVNAGVKLLEHTAGEHCNVQMGRLQMCTRSGHASRADCLKLAASFRRSGHAAEAKKQGVNRLQ